MRSSRDAGSRVRRFQPSFPFPAFSFLYIVYDFANRAEETTTEAMRNGEGVLSKMPRIAVQYDTDAGKEVVYDNQLPHRGFDGHIRVGSYKGESTSKAEEYVKARNSHAKERGLRNEYRLHGWRHEQRSVAEFLQASKTNERLRDMEETDKQLVARLIGTSHGHGRASFQYGTEYLLPVEGGSSREMNPELNVLSDRLFETGEWETLIDHTNQRYGFWGVSYLEALLRAADITCSKEGL